MTASGRRSPTPPAPAPTGELVVVPGEVQVGQTTLAVGFHVVPRDTEVVIQYSEHFEPEGEVCVASTPGSTQSAAAPTWVTLNACSVGKGYVRLVASATGQVIEEVDVTITQSGVARQATASVSLSDVTSAELVPGGSGDEFTVDATGLQSNRVYELNTIVLNGISAAFDRGCTDFDQTATIRLSTAATRDYDAFGCAAPGSYLWAWVEEVDGPTVGSSGLTDHFLNVADPTVEFSDSSYDVNEGSEKDITVNLSHPTGHRLRIPVTVTADTAESGDYSVSGLTRGELTFEPHDTEESFTVDTDHDDGCEDERIELSIGDLPSHVSEPSQDTQDEAEIVIADDEICVSFGLPRYTLNEGTTRHIEVELSRAPGRTVSVRVIVTPGTNRTVTFGSSATRNTFPYVAPHDRNCENEEVELTFGARPRGVVEGSPNVSRITHLDNDLYSPPVITGPASPNYAENGSDAVATYHASASCGGSIEWSLLNTPFEKDRGDFDISSTGVLTFEDTPDYEDPDDHNGDNEYLITVTASDGSSSDDQNVRITVTNVNEEPFVRSMIADRTMTAGATTTIDLSNTFGDPDGDTLNYTATSGDTSVVNAGIDGDMLTLDALSAGSVRVTVIAWDRPPRQPGTLWAFNQFTVTVELPPLEMPENLTYTLTRTEGAVSLDWDAVSDATGYEVRQCKRRRIPPGPCVYTTIQVLGSGVTTTTVDGLDTSESHMFIIRAVRGSQSADSSEITVNLRPAPQNLQGQYVAMQHRQLTLSWDPVPNPDVADDLDSNYHVEQLFPNLNPLDSGWRRLPHDGVTIGPTTTSGGRIQVVVSGLTPGEEYEHRIKAQSVQGKSSESNVVSTTVTDESPVAVPPTPTVSHLIGYRGFELQWVQNVRDASSYMVRATPDSPSLEFSFASGPHTVTEIPNSPWVEVSPGIGGFPGTLSLNVLGLVPGTDYTFSVKGHNGSGSGPAATSAGLLALEPTHWWGHQADHTVGYTIDAISEPRLQTAIPTAIALWNASINPGLSICDTADSDCRSRNSDGYTATIRTVAPSSPRDNLTGCGSSHACVAMIETGIEAPGGVGRHMTNMDVIFEDPPYGCPNSSDPTCPLIPMDLLIIYVWTSNPNMSGQEITPGPPREIYAHAEDLALHELGHTLGLPDFNSSTGGGRIDGLDGELAIMNVSWDAKSIQPTDIAQLDAIYRRHSRHDAK